LTLSSLPQYLLKYAALGQENRRLMTKLSNQSPFSKCGDMKNPDRARAGKYRMPGEYPVRKRSMNYIKDFAHHPLG
ncbi:MAG: hypothetical protein LBI31_00740, partial [Zoogloeaceae bacterium]|nr:hypothetical protein [Zoogloeaceae bacterium]